MHVGAGNAKNEPDVPYPARTHKRRGIMTAAPSISVASLHSQPLFFFNCSNCNLFILLFLAALGLVVARRFSLVAASRGLYSS